MLQPIPITIDLLHGDDDIRNLHDALIALMPPTRDIIKPLDPRPPLRADLEKYARMVKLEDGHYGKYTYLAIEVFQRQEKLKVWGNMDTPTATRLNQYLAKLGLITGGGGDGGSQGGGDGGGGGGEPTLRVSGTVRNQYGDLLADGSVAAFDRDLRSEQALGTDALEGGRYEITYVRSQFLQAEKDSADLVLTVLDAAGDILYRTPINYNVPDDCRIDISLGGVTYRGDSKWDMLTNTLIPLMGDLKPTELAETEDQPDVTFLAGETNLNRLLIATWIACFLLADKTAAEGDALPPEALFAFLGQGQPMPFSESTLQDMQVADRSTLLQENLLRGISGLDPALQRSLLEQAVDGNVVPALLKTRIAQILETLAAINLRHARDGVLGGGKGTIGQLLGLSLPDPDDTKIFMKAFVAHVGPLRDFWKGLVDSGSLPADKVSQVKLTFELGAMTRNHIPLVAALGAQFGDGQLVSKRDLAQRSRADWVGVFASNGPDGKPIGVPANIDGDTEEARRAQFAAIVDEQVQRTYPTAHFGASLSRSDNATLKAKADVVRFVSANPAFQLDRMRIDQFIKENPAALDKIEDKQGALADLKRVQRIFKLDSTFASVDALLVRGIDSAQQIYFMGPNQFQLAMKDSGVNAIDVKKVYQRSENAYALALTLYGQYNQSLARNAPAAVPDQAPDAETQAVIATLPNLATLFGSLDYCACTYCRSVYGPASYFVDIMRFLGDRQTQGSAINAGKSVQQVLLGRRPDMGEIELDCENTDTPLPYIDLVNEILEDAVSPPASVALDATIEAALVDGTIAAGVLAEFKDKGLPIGADARVHAPDSRGAWAVRDDEHAYKIVKTAGVLQASPTRQTHLSAAELAANPEYTNDDAYLELKRAVFPLDLPFDLSNLQGRACLSQLGIEQARLLELFQQTTAASTAPSGVQIDCAWMNVTETERAILADTLAGRKPWDYWGLAEAGNDVPDPATPADPNTNVKGTWIEVLGSVDVMLNRTGLAYQELQQLLDTRYVNPTHAVTIDDSADANAANCDVSLFDIRNLDQDTLGRMHRFIRLWRKLGCAMWELDILLRVTSAIANTVDDRITDAVLQDLSRMSRLRALKLDYRSIASLYPGMGIDNALFVDRMQGGTPEQTLYQRLFRNKLIDAVANFPADPDQITGAIADGVPGLLAALRITEADLALILADLAVAPSADLKANLQGIWRIAVLAQALTLGVDEFLRLKRLSGRDPFAQPQATRDFVELAGVVASSDFSILQLDYLLANRFQPRSGIALEDKTVALAMQALRDGLRKIADDLSIKPEMTGESYVRSKLGALPALGKDADQTLAAAIIDGSWVGSDGDRNAAIDRLFLGVLDPATDKVALAAIAAGLTAAERQAAVDLRFAYVQPPLEAFLLRTQTEAFVRQKIADVLHASVPAIGAILGLRLPGDAQTLLDHLDDPRLIALAADGSPLYALDEASFPAIFRALRLAQKVALMATLLGMRVDELSWWISGTNASDMGWMHPAELPIDTTTSVSLDKWRAIAGFFDWKNGLPASDVTAFDFASAVLDPAQTSSSNVAMLARLSAWDPADLDALAVAFRWRDTTVNPPIDSIKKNLRQTVSLVRLADCAAMLRRLGVNAARAIGWAVAEPGAAEADAMKQAVKARYDLPQWLKVVQPIQDSLREQKRQALVAWLVAHPNQARGQNWTDADGLYGYFLIDVEMCACMLTSRLKQAAGSVQLFAQRCLLNLEVDIRAETDADSKWKQWAWMKRFRVWEANRKVFLYPENWIEPELRDEKSPFFVELENELLQGDITTDLAETAFLNYLDKLDGVANLEIRALYEQITGEQETVLHVIGRTRSSQTPQYFYRTRINGARWTAWIPTGLDIEGDLVTLGVHNRRLYVFWTQLVEKSNTPTKVATPAASTSSTDIPQPDSYWETRLYWSEFKQGKWTPKVLTSQFALLRKREVDMTALALRIVDAPALTVQLFVTGAAATAAPSNLFDFEVGGKQIDCVTPRENVVSIKHDPIFQGEVWDIARTAWRLATSPGSQISNGLILNTTANVRYGYVSSLADDGTRLDLNNFAPVVVTFWPPATIATNSFALMGAAPPNSFCVVDSYDRSFNPEGLDQAFYWDRYRTYFVDYRGSTQTTYSRGFRDTVVVSTFTFRAHYHPYVELFIRELNVWGLRGLLNRQIQVAPTTIPMSPAAFDFTTYAPNNGIVVGPGPEVVDFDYDGGYAAYNWELFFHAPMLIANRLSANQRFEDALQWFHYIFDPTSTDTITPDPKTPQQKYWITKPFYETTKADYYKEKIGNILVAIAKGDVALRAQVEEWRDNPFDPHLIARMRTVAYQKNVLIKYIQAVISWGDQLFRQNTLETLNEATQLYVLASTVLGPRPRSIPKNVPDPVKTYYQLQQDQIDDFGNVLKDVENLLPAVPPAPGTSDDTPDLPHLEVLYFCIPDNDKLLGLWDLVADRLYKLRHCMNIEGVVQKLPLFEPPIDPALLVKAAAAGLDIGTLLADTNASTPLYRFSVTVQRAQELCSEVKALGAAMLQALERRDGEALALLRSSNELALLSQVRVVKSRQVDEAQALWDGLKEGRHIVEARQTHYQQLIDSGLNGWEIASLALTGGAIVSEVVATVLSGIAGGTSLIPEFSAGVAGFGGSPTVTVSMGGSQVSSSLSSAAEVVRSIGNILQMGSGMVSTIGGHARRADEWAFQLQLATTELPQVDKQISAADIRYSIAAQELTNHDRQVINLTSEDEYMRSGKFTNQELYDWMIGQTSSVYFQCYQLAYDMAKRAERSMRYELGLSDTGYIQFGYWDSLKRGLVAGERLSLDLKRLESAYYEKNQREYEITKHVSLFQLDPIALLMLRQNGECFVDIPEAAFDADFPGHYFRRLKTVSLSLPCVAGPYTTVACTLTMTGNRLRKDATLLAGKYARDTAADDSRFRDEIAPIQSIATSRTQADTGLFELSFHDERYLPFEGAGAISSWHIRLNGNVPQFDVASLSDVVLHLSYTAREGGAVLAAKASEAFEATLDAMLLAQQRSGLYRIYDLKREYPSEWQRFLYPATAAEDQALALDDLAARLPWFTKNFGRKVRRVEVAAKMKDGANYKVMLSPLGTDSASLLDLVPDPTYQGLHRAVKDLTGSEVSLDGWTFKMRLDGQPAPDFKSLPVDAVQELFLIVNYVIARGA